MTFLGAQMDVRHAIILLTASDMNNVPVIANTPGGLTRLIVAIRTWRKGEVTTIDLQGFHGHSLSWSRVRSEDVLLWESFDKQKQIPAEDQPLRGVVHIKIIYRCGSNLACFLCMS